MASIPGAQLGERFPPASGMLGRKALTSPDELVAVVGHSADDPATTAPPWQDPRRSDAYAGPTRVSGFKGAYDAGSDARQYAPLAQIALVLLVVPLLVLMGPTARLGLARRDARLHALRLAGATPRRAVMMTMVETGATAVIGALIGGWAALATAPLVARVPIGPGSWYPSDLVPSPLLLLALLIGVVVVAVGSSVVALRGVIIAPMGVAGRNTPRRLGPLRFLVFAALVVAFLFLGKRDVSSGVLVAVFAAVFGALALVGPWVITLPAAGAPAVAQRLRADLAGTGTQVSARPRGQRVAPCSR